MTNSLRVASLSIRFVIYRRSTVETDRRTAQAMQFDAPRCVSS